MPPRAMNSSIDTLDTMTSMIGTKGFDPLKTPRLSLDSTYVPSQPPLCVPRKGHLTKRVKYTEPRKNSILMPTLSDEECESDLSQGCPEMARLHSLSPGWLKPRPKRARGSNIIKEAADFFGDDELDLYFASPPLKVCCSMKSTNGIKLKQPRPLKRSCPYSAILR